MNIVIMAGGQGTRLWPLSRRKTPKQFLSLITESSLLADCYRRVAGLTKADRIFVSCVPEFVPFVRNILPEVRVDQIFAEPARRDSGPAMALVACRLARLGVADEPVAFIPTDHAIRDEARFANTLRVGLSLVREQPGFVDIGITPTEPLSTLGYTRIGQKLGERDGVDVYQFRGHVEKPDRAKAQAFLDSGEYLWHANYIMATPRIILDAVKQYAPEMFQVIDAYQEESADWEQSFAALPPISFDYAVAEHLPTDAMRVLRGDFGWSDIGQFAQLKQWVSPTGNVAKGKHIALDSDGCFVLGRPDKMIAILGVNDVAVIDTPDALLVCDLRRAAEVKTLVEALQRAGHDDVL